MLDRLAHALQRHPMVRPGMRLGAAVSGGADSMFLLHALHELAPRCNLHLHVVHVDHGIRGEASRRDAAFVQQAASGFALPFHLREASVPSVDDNLEQAARLVRHGFFRSVIAAGTLDRVATGHTLSDQAETVLYRLFRGSGLAGLSGILPVTPDGLVRPLLDFSRDEIEAWLRQRGIEWRQDETNELRAYARNRLRHDILPLLRAGFNPRLDQALAHLATMARDEQDYWNQEILPGLPSGSFQPAARVWTMPARQLTGLHPALARRSLRRILEAVKGDLRQIDFSHIETVLALARATEGSGRVQLPGLDIFRSFDWLRIAPAGYDSGRERDFELPVQPPASVPIPGGRQMTLELIECENAGQGYDKLKNELDWQRLILLSVPNAAGQGGARSGLLELRNWRPGDRYRPVGQSEEQKVKFLFQEARVPLWERRHWAILTCGGKIAWTRQFGAAAEFARGPATRTVLRLEEHPFPED